jgi:glycosyltransferase involved in cell wall biosynthesis
MVGSRGIPATYSGIEASLQEICPRLVQRGHSVCVYAAAGTAPGRATYAGVRLRRLPAIYTKHLETASRAFLSVLDEMFRFNDIVHFHALGPSLLSFLPRLTGKRTVATIHGLDWKHAKWGTAAKKVLKLGEWGAVRFPDATIVVSRSLKEYFRQKHGRDVVYIPNGVTIRRPRERKLLASLGLESAPYILFVSRLIPGKGLECLLRAFNKIETDHRLVLAGDAAYDRYYVEKLRRLAAGNHRVIFPGFVTGPLLEELFSNAEFYVFPSETEGLSISLLEAMSYARCVLVSDIVPNREVVADKGFYFRARDTEDLRRSIMWLIANKELAGRKGMEAREHVSKNYNWDGIVGRMEQLYADVLKRTRKPVP